MKTKSLFVGLLLLVGTVDVFAASNIGIKKTTKSKNLIATSCSVTVRTGKYDVTVTSTCTCTRREACDVAYKAASFFL
ncbi:hypothetical protein VB776_21205 [Arcicella sp. DC2W]|uniref:Uncharacterized protein n=1 Tax=Arcicella gelida TaxID=2984195 RepID=A0ABU5SAF5_9BACT|nr:hypothetical protein [Arcicella sp. DC2W]MEA5405471.1 hypothetical protein [Arcicella sp. DC2W]